jgi:large subunit ribosomal protein L3
MAIGVVGRKAGMTRIFTDAGASIPVTVIEVEPNRITQVRDDERDGYRAYQVTLGERKANRVSKPEAGHFAKAETEAGRGLWEFRLAEGEGQEIAVGNEIKVDVFEAGQKVDVTGNMGAARTTTQNLEVVRVDLERNLILIKGAVPGAKGGDVVIRPSVKARS